MPDTFSPAPAVATVVRWKSSLAVCVFLSTICSARLPPLRRILLTERFLRRSALLNGKNPEKEPQQTATTGKRGRKCCMYRIGVENSSILLFKPIFRCIVSSENRTGKKNITRNENIDEKIIFFVLVLLEIVAGHTSSRSRHAQALIRFLWKMLFLFCFLSISRVSHLAPCVNACYFNLHFDAMQTCRSILLLCSSLSQHFFPLCLRNRVQTSVIRVLPADGYRRSERNRQVDFHGKGSRRSTHLSSKMLTQCRTDSD